MLEQMRLHHHRHSGIGRQHRSSTCRCCRPDSLARSRNGDPVDDPPLNQGINCRCCRTGTRRARVSRARYTSNHERTRSAPSQPRTYSCPCPRTRSDNTSREPCKCCNCREGRARLLRLRRRLRSGEEAPPRLAPPFPSSTLPPRLPQTERTSVGTSSSRRHPPRLRPEGLSSTRASVRVGTKLDLVGARRTVPPGVPLASRGPGPHLGG